MTDYLNSTLQLDYRILIDGLGDGILIFDSVGRLVADNAAARQILGRNMDIVRAQGWNACAILIDSGKGGESPTAEEIRLQTLNASEPMRFHLLLSDVYLPCWASGIRAGESQMMTMITISRPDWTFFSNLMSRFREEAESAIDSTRGHADLIIQITNRRTKNTTTDQLAERVIGFARIMSVQMRRVQDLLEHLHRLEDIRTGQMNLDVKKNLKKVKLENFFEDFLEDVADKPLHDEPKAQDVDIRDRLEVDVPSDLNVLAAPIYLTYCVRDILKNAVMYSAAKAPIKLRAFSTSQGAYAQIDITDHGYGIREKESDRVFKPFQRARQPEIIAEFGYGLSLYLTKANIEAMGGKIWFSSEEGVSTTFSIKLPIYKETG